LRGVPDRSPPRLYGLTVTVALTEVTPPEVAVMVAFPVVTAVTSPLLGEVFEMVATELGTDVQVAMPVTLAVEPLA
jgi:hypothetical protein